MTLIFPFRYFSAIKAKSETSRPFSPKGMKKALSGSRDKETPNTGDEGRYPSDRNSKATSWEENIRAFSSLFSTSVLSERIS